MAGRSSRLFIGQEQYWRKKDRRVRVTARWQWVKGAGLDPEDS